MKNPQIPQVLKEYRKKNNFSVADVSLMLQERSIKVAPKTIYGWESGQANPSADTLLVLCEMYNISNVLSAFGYHDEASVFCVSPSERALIESYRKHPELQKAVNKLLDLNMIRRTVEAKEDI